MRARYVAFVTVMGALGNAFALLTIAPTMIQQVALDFSNLPILIAAVFIGPAIGIEVGLIAGIIPMWYFGFVGSLSFLSFLVPVGKAMTGAAVGLLTRLVNPFSRRRGYLWIILIVLIGFIPEMLVIIATFGLLVNLFLPAETAVFLAGFLIPILVKAWFEMIVIALFISALAGNVGFREFLDSFVRPRRL